MSQGELFSCGPKSPSLLAVLAFRWPPLSQRDDKTKECEEDTHALPEWQSGGAEKVMQRPSQKNYWPGHEGEHSRPENYVDGHSDGHQHNWEDFLHFSHLLSKGELKAKGRLLPFKDKLWAKVNTYIIHDRKSQAKCPKYGIIWNRKLFFGWKIQSIQRNSRRHRHIKGFFLAKHRNFYGKLTVF